MVVFPRIYKSAGRVLAILLAFCMMAGTTQARADVKAGTAGKAEASQFSVAPDTGLPAGAEDRQVSVIVTLDKPGLEDAGFDAESAASSPEALAYLDELKAYQEKALDMIKEALGTSDLKSRGSLRVLTDALFLELPESGLDAVRQLGFVVKVSSGSQRTTADGKMGDRIHAKGHVSSDSPATAGSTRVVSDSPAEPATEPDRLTLTAGEMVEKDSAWSKGYTGAGMRIAIIDDGMQADHPSFAEDAFLYSLEETAAKAGKTIKDYNLLDEREVKSLLGRLHAGEMCEEGTEELLYRSAKIPFGFNYASASIEIFDEYSSGHGMHVAGIAAANRYVDHDGEFGPERLGVAGVAPDAQIIAMHVFTNGTNPYDYMMAIEDALLLGADAINLSLGGAEAGYADPAAEDEMFCDIMKKVRESDAVVAIAAGNSYAWADMEYNGYALNRAAEINLSTLASPASFTDSLAVASDVNIGYVGTPLIFDGSVKAFEVAVSDEFGDDMDTLGSLEGADEGKSFDYVYIEGFGTPEDYENIDVEGKIVMVDRGEITFAEKHAAAVSAGAIAVVICNNAPGAMNFSVGVDPAPVPCVAISIFDALAVEANADYDTEKRIHFGTMRVGSETEYARPEEYGYIPSDFSSWGVPEDLSLKPEIMAPGDDIYSTYPDDEYGAMGGTSMATPMISGLAALVIQHIEENNLTESTGLSKRALAQAILMSTADPIRKTDGVEYSPRKQGAGLANAQNATSTPAYLLVGPEEGNDGKVKAELGDDPDRKGVYSFDFTVKNMNPGKELYYTLDSSALTESLDSDDSGMLFITEDSMQLSPKATYSSSDKLVLTYDLDGNGKVDGKDAKVLRSYVKKGGKKKAGAVFKNCYWEFDLNDDGAVNKKDATALAKAVKKPAKSNIDLSKHTLIVADDEASVSVKIKLTKGDRDYLENFPNGIFVEGYVYLYGETVLSLPFLAFYGDWSDSSMYEPFDYIEYRHGSFDWWIYTLEAPEVTNYFLFFSKARKDEFKYASNPFVRDQFYMPERNAFSSTSGDVLEELDVTYLRNARYICAKIENAETGDVYFEQDEEYWVGAFYNYNDGKWEVTHDRFVFGWKGTDADGNPLPDGTKVLVSLTSVPEYYKSIDEAKGRGTTISLPLVIDNTAPTAKAGKSGTRTDKKGNAIDTLTVRVKDDRYVAAVVVYDADKKNVIKRYAVNQTKPGVTKKVVIDRPAEDCYVAVYDYAGNETGFDLAN
ncbi:MAG: S8 family serine peptidase [Lachnospiraceae bacterium]|nr:S8 family serine peptidase [Lachnospiraceae bacterium]